MINLTFAVMQFLTNIAGCPRPSRIAVTLELVDAINTRPVCTGATNTLIDIYVQDKENTNTI